MRPYLAVVSGRFRALLQYRVAAFAGFVTQAFWGAIKLMVLSAFYAVAEDPPPLSFEAVVAYVWLGQMLLGLLPWNNDPEIQRQFRTGAVAFELLRPLDLYTFWYFRTIAFRTAPTFLRTIPCLFFAFFVLRWIELDEWAMTLPPDLLQSLAFLASLACAVLLSCAVQMLLNISLFWLIEGRGLATFAGGVVAVFSGMIVPLPLFPPWAQWFLEWQPFRGICDVPYRIYSGNIPLETVPFELCFQLGWTLVLIVLGQLLLRRATSKLVVQGG